MYYIGLDLGTTGCKCIVFDENGKMSGSSYLEYPLILVSDTEIEQDANLWRELCIRAIDSALIEGNIDRTRVRAISVSSQGISVVPVDKNNTPLYNAISWLDKRAQSEAGYISECIDEEEIFKITGKRPSANYTAAKILWFKNNLPEIYEKTYKFLMPHDFITACFTNGSFITDYTMASGTMLFDITKFCWSEKIAESIGIELEKLPTILPSGSFAGYISEHVSKLLSLPQSVIIGVGGQDQKVAALGAGIDSKTATLSLGTAGAIEFMCDFPVFDQDRRLPCFSYLKKNQWVLEGVVSTCGAGLKWLKSTIFSDCSYCEIDNLASTSPLGSSGVRFTPHFAGASSPHWQSNCKAAISGITLSTTKADISRSILEGVAFEIRENIEVFRKLSNNEISAFKVFGGGTGSDIWNQIIADITGIDLTTFESPDIANYGAAILAFEASGDKGGIGTQFVDKTKIFIADVESKEKYDEIFKIYQDNERILLNGCR